MPDDSAHLEYEIKLAIEPDLVERLPQTLWFTKLQLLGSGTRQLQAVYYDTPDFAVKAQGASLRVRREDQQYVQCLKLRTATLNQRREYETTVPDDRLRPELLRLKNGADCSLQVDLAALRPVFSTDVQRRVWRVSAAGGVEFEIDLDVGALITDQARLPICEIELELRAGPPSLLAALAADLAAELPLQLMLDSKAKRGYRLAAGKAPATDYHKARKLSLSAEMTVETAMAAMLNQGLEQLRLNEACVLARSDIEGVHQMRVALRRLRGVLAVHRKCLPVEPLAHWRQEFKWLTELLGAARDWDVFCREILGPVAADVPDNAGLQQLARLATDCCDQAYDRVGAALGSPRYVRLVLGFEAWIAEQGWRQQPLGEASVLLFRPVTTIAAKLLDQRHRRLLKAGKRFKKLSDDRRHALRLDAKKLRYAAEFFCSLYNDKAARSYLQPLRRLQDALGQLNDVVVARVLLEQLLAAATVDQAASMWLAAGLVQGWHEHRVRSGRCDPAAGWERFIGAKRFW